MARFAANLTFLFTELPMLDRFAAARRAGFEGAEVLFPFDLAAPELASAARSAGVEFVLMNTPPPNWAGSPRGFAAVPGGEERFRRDFDRVLRFAQALRAEPRAAVRRLPRPPDHRGRSRRLGAPGRARPAHPDRGLARAP